ncbi:MAG: gliding motility lipoprotein GldH [Cytophagales bacterium]|nr:gliding motility lipoprotein GldH [Cytophagales bacterium]
MRRSSSLFWIACLLFLGACDASRIYEKDVSFEQQEWLISEQPEFEFEIKKAGQHCNLLVNIRNGVEYPFQNLYFKYALENESGDTLAQELVNVQLFDSKTGKPMGVGLGSIYDVQKSVLKDFEFQKTGNYLFRIKQAMRSDTLAGVVSAGLRVEKARKHVPAAN